MTPVGTDDNGPSTGWKKLQLKWSLLVVYVIFSGVPEYEKKVNVIPLNCFKELEGPLLPNL